MCKQKKFNKSLGRKNLKRSKKLSSNKRRIAQNKSDTITHSRTKRRDPLPPINLTNFSPKEKDDYDVDFNSFAFQESHNENDFSNFFVSPPPDFSIAQNIQTNDPIDEINKISQEPLKMINDMTLYICKYINNLLKAFRFLAHVYNREKLCKNAKLKEKGKILSACLLAQKKI